tara:strand:- start:511 stop:720 length:210 start_codon:yes stop_codon:yes gene_type:complete
MTLVGFFRTKIVRKICSITALHIVFFGGGFTQQAVKATETGGDGGTLKDALKLEEFICNFSLRSCGAAP